MKALLITVAVSVPWLRHPERVCPRSPTVLNDEMRVLKAKPADH
jgi:hypothetical protein